MVEAPAIRLRHPLASEPAPRAGQTAPDRAACAGLRAAGSRPSSARSQAPSASGEPPEARSRNRWKATEVRRSRREFATETQRHRGIRRGRPAEQAGSESVLIRKRKPDASSPPACVFGLGRTQPPLRGAAPNASVAGRFQTGVLLCDSVSLWPMFPVPPWRVLAPQPSGHGDRGHGDDLALERRAFQALGYDRDAEAGTRRHGNRAVAIDLDRRIDEVWIEVAFAGGDVARQ